MSPIEMYYETLGATLVKKLEKRGFSACYQPTKEAAVCSVMELLPEHATVTWGGTETLSQSGMLDALKASSLTLIDRSAAKNEEEKKELYRRAFFADYYFMSSNAITLDGELINIDGTGNRLAALCYGPEHIIMLVGINKVAADVKSGIDRVRNVASPLNAMRLSIPTPCSKTGTYADCLSDNCICNQILITRRSKPQGRIHVVLIGEALGF